MDNTKETVSRGVKHFIIGARDGHKKSLDVSEEGFHRGLCKLKKSMKIHYGPIMRV